MVSPFISALTYYAAFIIQIHVMSHANSLLSLLTNPFTAFSGTPEAVPPTYFMYEDEMLIHQRQDSWGNIQVLDQAGQRVLSFDSVYEQSRMDLRQQGLLVHQYTRAMLLSMAFAKPAHITLLGLGGGCLLRAMQLIDPYLHIQVVELRKAVVDIAQDYFGLPQLANARIQVADARHYIVQQANASTDLIFADMYHAVRADPFQMQKQFFRESQRILSPTGWLVINCHKPPSSGSFFLRFLQQYFNTIRQCVLPGGNVVFYASKSGIMPPFNTLSDAVDLLESRTGSYMHHLLNYLEPLATSPASQSV